LKTDSLRQKWHKESARPSAGLAIGCSLRADCPDRPQIVNAGDQVAAIVLTAWRVNFAAMRRQYTIDDS
jgi:hypothetical protein